MKFTPLPPEKRLTEDKAKIQEAILYLMGLHPNVSQYEIVKSLFLADRSHMNRHGRPVTFDNYIAMEHGPVPSLAYDALKPKFNFKSAFSANRPWTSIPDAAHPNVNHFTALREAKREYLSVSDMKALESALGTVLSLSFEQLRRLTHEDRAYVEAWKRRGNSNAAKMRLSLLIDENGDELEDELVYISSHS
jgi:uncharacterized phage-associated protein